MSAARKGFYYKRLTAAGVPFDKHFRNYTEAELIEAHAAAVQAGLVEEPTAEELAQLEKQVHAPRPRRKLEETTVDMDDAETPLPAPAQNRRLPPLSHAEELPGERLNTNPDEQVVRVDELGRQWLQEEVRKPAYPKPRGRRVLRYMDAGVKQQTVVQGEYTETFEVAGDPKNATPSEIKITLPSYQVGIYRDRRFPFKVITYGGNSGFDRLEVEAFYGARELVPAECKRIYVENVLCYDMRSVIRAINTEYRQQQLAGNI